MDRRQSRKRRSKEALTDGVIETLDKTDDRRLSASRLTDEGDSLSRQDLHVHLLQDRDIGTTWVVKVDIADNDVALKVFGFSAIRVGRVDGWNAVDGFEDVVGRSLSVGKG